MDGKRFVIPNTFTLHVTRREHVPINESKAFHTARALAANLLSGVAHAPIRLHLLQPASQAQTPTAGSPGPLARRSVATCTIQRPTDPLAVAVQKLALESRRGPVDASHPTRMAAALSKACGAIRYLPDARRLVPQLVTALGAPNIAPPHLGALVDAVARIGRVDSARHGMATSTTFNAACDALADALVNQPLAGRSLQGLATALAGLRAGTRDGSRLEPVALRVVARVLESLGLQRRTVPAELAAELIRQAASNWPDAWEQVPLRLDEARDRLVYALGVLLSSRLNPGLPADAALTALAAAVTDACFDVWRPPGGVQQPVVDGTGWLMRRWFLQLAFCERADLRLLTTAVRRFLGTSFQFSLERTHRALELVLESGLMNRATLARILLGPDGLLTGHQARALRPTWVEAPHGSATLSPAAMRVFDMNGFTALDVVNGQYDWITPGSPVHQAWRSEVLVPLSRVLPHLMPTRAWTLVNAVLRRFAQSQMPELVSPTVADVLRAQGPEISGRLLMDLLQLAAFHVRAASDPVFAGSLDELLAAVPEAHRSIGLPCLMLGSLQQGDVPGNTARALGLLAAWAGGPDGILEDPAMADHEVLAAIAGMALALNALDASPAREKSLLTALRELLAQREPTGDRRRFERGSKRVAALLGTGVALASRPLQVLHHPAFKDNPVVQFRLLSLALSNTPSHNEARAGVIAGRLERRHKMPDWLRDPLLVQAAQWELDVETFGRVHRRLLARHPGTAKSAAVGGTPVDAKGQRDAINLLDGEGSDSVAHALMDEALGPWGHHAVPGPVGHLLGFYEMLEDSSGLMYLHGRHPEDVTPARVKAHAPQIRERLAMLKVARQQVRTLMADRPGDQAVLLQRLDLFGGALEKGLAMTDARADSKADSKAESKA